MTRTNRFISGLMALSALGGCASQATTNALAVAQQNYAATAQACQAGNQMACYQLPSAQAYLGAVQQQYQAEQQYNAATGAALVGTAAAIGLGAAALSGGPGPHGPGPGPGPGGFHGPPPGPH